MTLRCGRTDNDKLMLRTHQNVSSILAVCACMWDGGTPQDRFSTSSSASRGGDQGAGKNVVIEVFAHGASGKEAVLVAYLSNAVLLVLRVGAEGLRSWLLEWPVAGKVRETLHEYQ